MYMDKKQNIYQYPQYNPQYPNNYNRGQGNRKSWPRMNPRQHRRTGSSVYFTDHDGDTDMGSGYGSSRGKNKFRYTPGYKGRPNKSKNLQGGGWWKIVVYDADKFDKDDFFKMLDNTTNESIDPQGTHVSRNKLIFWIKNTRAKDAIKNQSAKLTLKDHTVNLFAVMSDGPEIRLTKDEHKAKICNALIKRYSENTLNLSDFNRDEDLKGTRSRLYETAPILGELIEEKCADLIHEIDFSSNNLNSTGCLRGILTACKSLVRIKFDNNYIKMLPELKQLKVFAPNITHFSLINNPIKNLLDNAQYISDIRKMFPKLIQLDNVPLPEKIKFDAEQTVALPPTKKFSILLEVGHKSAVENFFLKYVKIHDSGPECRSQLAPAYDETCLFSCATSWRMRGEVKDKFPVKMPSDLLKRNRNFKHCSQAELKESRLFIGRENVVKELCEMAPTKHLLHTLNIDTSTILNNHVTAILDGIIDTPNDYRTFSRTFVLAGNPTNGLFLILNDQISAIRSNPETIKNIEYPDFGIVPGVSSNVNRADLLKRIQEATKMTTEYCTQCLEASGWNFERAMSIFGDMKAKGSIPAHVFIK